MKKPTIKLFNSLKRSLEEFIPLEENKVSIYTCGPTVYDSSHIGHARSFIVWDCWVRFFREINYEVKWARNITDIDDKIINRSIEMGIEPQKLARIETYKYWKDMHSLNVQWPDYEPKATENLPQMFAFIEGLMRKGFAYQAENGDIYFKVSAFEHYGQLKNIKNEAENISRLENLNSKENTCDFALWKAFNRNEYGFESPFGHGRPGWHLECSAMIKNIFGQTIDIHGGGEDLTFPHHENEIAQSEALHSCQFSRYWIHNGLVLVNGRKMSKSEGNFITIESALKNYSGNAIRFFVLSAHYRQSVNYTEEALQAAQNGINKLFQIFAHDEKIEIDKNNLNPTFMDNFYQYLAEDLNTACALSVTFEIAKLINKSEGNIIELKNTLAHILSVLGFNLTEKPINSCDEKTQNSIVKLLLDIRNNAREVKNFQLADQIRLHFEKAGYKLKDSAEGTDLICLSKV